MSPEVFGELLILIGCIVVISAGVIAAGTYYGRAGRAVPPLPLVNTLEFRYPFNHRGGARIGQTSLWAMHASVPCIPYGASSKEIYIDGGWALEIFWGKRRLILPKVQIQRISCYGAGLCIEHTISGYPPFIVLWSLDIQMVAMAFEQLGYQIER